MNKHLLSGIAAATFAASLACAAPASAAVTFDPAAGTGFVGKGDVQLLAGWSNKQLQDNAKDVGFQYSRVSSVTTTWTCDKDTGTQTQERNNTTTKTTEGVVTSIARERNQITGFILNGYDGGAPIIEEEKDGPSVGSCPDKWTAIDVVVGEPEIVKSVLFLLVGGVDKGELIIAPPSTL